MDDKLADRRKHPRILQLIFTKQKGQQTKLYNYQILKV